MKPTIKNRNPFNVIEAGVILEVSNAENEAIATTAVENYITKAGKENEVGYDASVSQEDGVYFIRLVELH
jgi:hypothetical protein